MGALGYRFPPDYDHVTRYSLAAVVRETVPTVERTLRLPWWHRKHDQGREGSCVGHGVAMERSICNTAQNRLLFLLRPGRRYDPIWLWNEAKKVDEWPDTNPGDSEGTSLRAAYDVAREQGMCRVRSMAMRADLHGELLPRPVGLKPPSLDEGVATNRWATSVDQIRTAVSLGSPVAIGINWYSEFDEPEIYRNEWWIAHYGLSGPIRGGHCVCVYGASDRRGALKLKNSWGEEYPLVWLPYAVMAKLLREGGEAAVVVDR